MKIINYLKEALLCYIGVSIAVVLCIWGLVSIGAGLSGSRFYLLDVWQESLFIIFHPLFILFVLLLSLLFYIRTSRKDLLNVQQVSTPITIGRIAKIFLIISLIMLGLIVVPLLIKFII